MPAGMPSDAASTSGPYSFVMRSVAWMPGCTVLTVTPSLATSVATVLRNAVTPDRAVLDRINPPIGWRTATDVMATTRPQPCDCIAGTADLHMPTMLNRLRSIAG